MNKLSRKKIIGGRYYYQVKWKGYGNETTDEPEINLLEFAEDKVRKASDYMMMIIFTRFIKTYRQKSTSDDWR